MTNGHGSDRKKGWLPRVTPEFGLTLAMAIVAAGAAFLATRASLETRLAKVESELIVNRELRNFFGRTLAYKQQSDLRVLEDEIDRLERFVTNWVKPNFVFKSGRPANFPPGEPWDEKSEWLDKRVDQGGEMPSGIDIRLYSTIAMNPNFGGIHDIELVAALHRILHLAAEFNDSIVAITPEFLGPQPAIPQIQRYTRRDDIERFIQATEGRVAELKGLLSGMKARLQAARRVLDGVSGTQADIS
jgi:hypothetical protein